MKKIFLIFTIILFSAATVNAQYYRESFTKTIDGYTFKSDYDTNEYTTTLTIEKNGKRIFKEIYPEIIDNIQKLSLESKGDSYIFIDFFSGGAHCCFSTIIGNFKDNKFVISDSGFYGNSGYALDDLNKDGVKEIISGNDMFAYAFTNYAETRFTLRVQTIEDGKLVDITSDFKPQLEDEIKEFKKDLDDLIKEGIACPDDPNEDTFNTSAGSAKTILAAIVADYYSLGKVRRGYDLIDKVYKCADKEKFKKILKEDFKLY